MPQDRKEMFIFDLVILEINWKLPQVAEAQEVIGKKVNPFVFRILVLDHGIHSCMQPGAEQCMYKNKNEKS